MQSWSVLFSSTSVFTVGRRLLLVGGSQPGALNRSFVLLVRYGSRRSAIAGSYSKGSSTALLSKIKWNGSFSSRSRLIASRNSSSFERSGKKQDATVFSKTSRE